MYVVTRYIQHTKNTSLFTRAWPHDGLKRRVKSRARALLLLRNKLPTRVCFSPSHKSNNRNIVLKFIPRFKNSMYKVCLVKLLI